MPATINLFLWDQDEYTFGGQTTIFGKWTSYIGNVSTYVSMGDFSQSKNAMLMMKPAEQNPKSTIAIQNNLLNLFLVVDM